MDILRGIAVMGILAVNITDFAGQGMAGAVLSFPRHASGAGHARLNLVVYFLEFIFISGKMRGLLSMLLGAGVVLMTGRLEKRRGSKQAAGVFLRRNLWMIVLGLLHAYFVWHGDFIFLYGVTSLVLLYACRRLSPKPLLIAGLLITLVPGTYCYLFFHKQVEEVFLAGRSALATADLRAGKSLTAAQKLDQKTWNKELTPLTYNQQKIDAEVRAGQRGYSVWLKQKLGPFFRDELKFVGVVLGDSGGMMLSGMALFKMGFLTTELSYATYAWTAILGSLASLPISLFGLLKAQAAGFAPGVVACWMSLPFKFTNIGATLAIAACLLLVIKSGMFRNLANCLAAVGQTALTSYLCSNVICQFLFAWGPWKLYGQLQFYQIYFCVLGVWLLNLVVSPIWLRYFAFGSFEWILRSLTYQKIQPMFICGTVASL